MTDTADMVGQEVYQLVRQAAQAAMRQLCQQSAARKTGRKARRHMRRAHKSINKANAGVDTPATDADLRQTDTVIFHLKTVPWDREGDLVATALRTDGISCAVHAISDDMVGIEINRADVPRTKQVIDALCNDKIRGMHLGRYPNYREIFVENKTPEAVKNVDEILSVTVEKEEVAELLSAALDRAGISHDVLSHEGKYDVLVSNLDMTEKSEIADEYIHTATPTRKSVAPKQPERTVKYTPPQKKSYTPTADKKMAKKTAAKLSQNKTVRRTLKEVRSL